jgi:hypothetical protein
MNVIVHFPKTLQSIRELETQVAKVHADAVIRYLTEQTCPTEQRVQLLRAVQKKAESSPKP